MLLTGESFTSVEADMCTIDRCNDMGFYEYSHRADLIFFVLNRITTLLLMQFGPHPTV